MCKKLNLLWLCGWLTLTGHQVPTKAALSPQLDREEYKYNERFMG